MTDSNRLNELQLASLIGSRICHDIISLMGNIGNGMEMLETSRDPEIRQAALDLIANSGRRAANRLAYARLAFGAAGSLGDDISLGDARALAENLLADDKRATLNWRAPLENRPKAVVKLLLNLLLMARECIPRGGELVVDVNGDEMVLTAKGSRAALPEKLAAVLTGEMAAEKIDAHLVQPYYTLLLLQEANYGLDVEQGEDEIVLRAGP